MSIAPLSLRQRQRKALRALAGLALLTAAGPAASDDRDLLRDSVGEPYVFILLDTSGSMNWSPKCTAEQLAQGECSQLCPSGDCYTRLQSDDPGSKFYQAKQALYEVLEKVDDIHFGFATYNQDELRMRSKHWLYQAREDGPVIPGWGPFPATGADEVFGSLWPCDQGNGDDEVGCARATPADLSDAWERSRMARLPKGGASLGQTVTIFVRHGGQVYRVQYQPDSGSLGGGIELRVVAERCNNTSCSNRTFIGAEEVEYAPVGEFASWDAGVDRTNPELGYFDQGQVADPLSGNTCAGWDPNDDLGSDLYNGYRTRWPTDTSDPRGAPLYKGDMIPLDWQDDHRGDIQRRLAPNLALSPLATPDFRVAPYFANAPRSGEDFLRLKNEAARPFLASGSTPLGNSVRSFRTWYAGCPQGTCPRGSGWKEIAAAQDPDWACRRKFLLVITDGDDTCPGADACSGTASLFAQEGIKTYVVAFGVENSSGNRLTCMAANGGSGEPIYPQNKEDLVEALTEIFGQIREEASAFASAAVPSVQAEVADRLYLSSFTPLNLASVWQGRLDAFLKPLPLTPDGQPDRDRSCPPASSSGRSSCHLWDAGEVLLGQAPAAAPVDQAVAAGNLDANVLQLGLGPNERRVFYPRGGFGGVTPRELRLFAPPQGNPRTDPEWADLWRGLRIPQPATDPEFVNAKNRAAGIIGKTLARKTGTIEPLSGPPIEVEYVLGDVFHSDPVIVDSPNDFTFYSADLYGDGSDCATNPGYRCFADRQRRRRKMLAVGSNDGQLHVFDAGVWDPGQQRFTDGTGREIFSYIPRIGLPLVRELAEGSSQIFGLDGTSRISDVFLDPRHNGVPSPSQREWRTVLLGGFREGGSRDGGGRVADFVSGYYALDITQPDRLDADDEPINQNVVPSCLTTDNQAVAGCGSLPFPSVLWEFTDSITASQLDEDDVNGDGSPDGNGEPDLGQTWSVPTIGRIRVVQDGDEVDKFVAIFGGGMDAESKPSPRRGNWLYMVDIETGAALYKRQLVGAAPGDPAVLDKDLNGYLDTIYIGTTAGFLYKVDIGSPATLEEVTLRRNLALPALAADATVLRITDKDWEPFPIFDTVRRPIYLTPTAFFVSRLNRFALAFGTGDREDLWAFDGQEGRFYVIVDEGYTASQVAAGDLPKSESDYQEVLAGGASAAEDADFVLNPPTGKDRGWYLRLEADERVITQPFGLSGILIFSSYRPQVVVSGGSGGGGRNDDAVCARSGESRIFVVFANNANAIMSVAGAPSRFRLVPEFVTSPYVEQGVTKNPTPEGGGGRDSEDLDPTQQQIMAALRERAPRECKFANYWFSVSGIRSDVRYERYATIPICTIQRNWKEH
jgi:Tfp pilus tip-associated adhesin PilY1